MNYNPRTEEAYNLFHKGVLALARMEEAGMRIDLSYIERKKNQLTRKIDRLEEEFKETEFYHQWERSAKGEVNINSDTQLRYFLYNVKKYKPVKFTDGGQGSTDAESLSQLNIPELEILAERDKIKRLRDVNLDGLAREQVDGYVHAFFNLHLARSYRSCVAKGTLVLAVKDFLKYPKGVPIEEIKQGDYVYCFNDNLQPTIGKVSWAGKTGCRKVIRIYYSVNGGHGKGFLDVTPEHRIRLIDGSYEQAQNLIGDFRTQKEDKHLQKIRTLSCARVEDKLNFTGHLKYGKGLLEHRLIYSKLIGKITEEDIIHHENLNHLDHTPSNLKKTNLSDHSRYHSKNVSDEIKKIRIKALNDNRHKIIHKRGTESPNYLGLSKFTCYKLTAEVAGHITKVKYDFNTFKKYLELYNIDFVEIMMRYDKYGNYIWKSKLKELSKIGRSEVSKILGHNSNRLIRLYNLYGIDTSRRWANQFGPFKPGNHNIIKIEWINKIVDVYDIDVEEHHNFFANEICVHNSSDHPNLQNIPVKDEESMQIVRKAIYPRPGHQLLEVDFKAIEVCVNACYNKDSNLIKYVSNPLSDMHADMAKQIFKIDKFDKTIPEHYILRQAVKNGFVFPEFYGDYYKNCAENVLMNWGKLPKGKWKASQGIKMPEGFLSDHLISVGFPSFNVFTEHLKKIEEDLWSRRFPEYAEWKERWFKVYCKYGYFDMLTGFRCGGVMDIRQVISIPAQGTAFHCLLWSLVETDRIMQKRKWNTRIISQVHDSLILDVNSNELETVVKTIKTITTIKLPEAWKWIIVPLSVDFSISPVDGSWSEKQTFKL